MSASLPNMFENRFPNIAAYVRCVSYSDLPGTEEEKDKCLNDLYEQMQGIPVWLNALNDMLGQVNKQAEVVANRQFGG